MRKLFLIITSIIVLLGIWLLISSNQATESTTSIQAKLADVKDYKYYLDQGNDKIGKEMATMDLVIVEPIEMQQKYIDHAQKKWNTSIRLYKCYGSRQMEFSAL